MDNNERKHLEYLNEAQSNTYNGWTNWDTWQTYNLLTMEAFLYKITAYKASKGYMAFYNHVIEFLELYNAHDDDGWGPQIYDVNMEEVYEAFIE